MCIALFRTAMILLPICLATEENRAHNKVTPTKDIE
jgi:hypothetical protein